jgi:hypothetical protein
MDSKPKITAVRSGINNKVHVHATVTVPTLGYKLTLTPTPGKAGELDLKLTVPPKGTPEGDIVSHPEADATLIVGSTEKKLTVNYDGKAIHVTIKDTTT